MTARMNRLMMSAAAALALALPVSAQDETADAPPGPSDIVNAAPQSEWVTIAPEDLLVMTLAPDAQGKERKVVIQLMPSPFSQGWVSNIRTLARTEWYDGITVNRVQDNYVVQWGDPGHDNPESGEVKTKALPEGLKVMGEEDYAATVSWQMLADPVQHIYFRDPKISLIAGYGPPFREPGHCSMGIQQ